MAPESHSKISQDMQNLFLRSGVIYFYRSKVSAVNGAIFKSNILFIKTSRWVWKRLMITFLLFALLSTWHPHLCSAQNQLHSRSSTFLKVHSQLLHTHSHVAVVRQQSWWHPLKENNEATFYHQNHWTDFSFSTCVNLLWKRRLFLCSKIKNIMKTTVFFMSYRAMHFGPGSGPLKGTSVQHKKSTFFSKVQKVPIKMTNFKVKTPFFL